MAFFHFYLGKAEGEIKPLDNPEDYPIFSNQEPVYEYYRDNFLNDRQKIVYDNYVEAARQFKPKFNPGVEELSSEEMLQIYHFVIADHPELFWIESYKPLELFGKVYTKLNIRVIYRYNEEEAKAKNEVIKKSYEPIIEEAKKLKTDEEKVHYVRERIMDRAHYGKAKEDNPEDYQCMISIFETGRSLCGGYSYGFKFIMDRVGVTSINVLHLEKESANSHIWNMVKLKDTWYNLDISYDDTIRDKYHHEEKYYLVDNDTFYKDHKINEYLPNL